VISTPEGGALLPALEQSPLAAAMRGELWLYPIVEICHIVGLVVLVGTVFVFDLRLLGLSRRVPVRMLARHALPWSAAALLVIVPTGLMMFATHATDFVENRAFVTKLILILLALTNAAAFHAGVFRTAHRWDVDVSPPIPAKLHAIAALGIWLSVIACGRLIAYL
jgi:hypothetical protein